MELGDFGPVLNGSGSVCNIVKDTIIFSYMELKVTFMNNNKSHLHSQRRVIQALW